MTASNLVETARSYLGVAEGSAAHRAIVDKYNTILPLPRGYQVAYTDAWCAVFVSFCALISGTVLPLECGCQEMYAAFPAKKSRTATPGLGWIIFYDWNQDGHTEHVGIVEAVKDGVITVIEGNHADAVGRRQIRVGDPTIYGYGVPEFKEDIKVGNAQTIWDYLLKWIGNPEGVAGLMGNLRAESALRPNNLQDRFEQGLGLSDVQYTAKVDDGSYANFIYDSAGYGLAQWTFWSRKKALLEYARSRKASIGDLHMQLDFLKKEMVENYPTLVASLQQAKTVREASNAVLFIYERPADQGQKVQDLRASYGETYYKEYAGKEKAMAITRTSFIEGLAETAKFGFDRRLVWGDSHSIPPCEDGKGSCDRLHSRTLWKKFGVTWQKPGGWNSAELAQHLPELCFTKITDKSKIVPGTVIMVGKWVDGKWDPTYHSFTVVKYDPATDLCDKYDWGDTWRIQAPQPFRGVKLCEWPERKFTMGFIPPDDPIPAKTSKDCVKEGQEALNKLFNAGLKVDGDRARLTETAFIKAFQDAMNRDYYSDGKMPVNGKLTNLTKAALGTHYVEHNEPKQYLTTIVEIGQLLAGRDPDGVEFPGNYGDGLVKATGKTRMTAADILAMFKPELIEE